MSTHSYQPITNYNSKLIKKTVVFIIMVGLTVKLFKKISKNSTENDVPSHLSSRHQRHSSMISFNHNYSEYGLSGLKLQRIVEKLNEIVWIWFVKM